jgi:ribonuclease inhibitor
MKRATLDGSIGSLDAAYALLARELDLPDYFGWNLDALWDVLTAEVPGPVEIVWRDHEAARMRMGEDFDRLVELFREVEQERPDFRLDLE